MRKFVLLDKPKGKSSFKLVAETRKETGVKRVGHTGTLDPLATGLLLVAVGEATKLIEYLMGCDKEYETEVEFGVVSDTFDAEGQLVDCGFDGEVSGEEVARAIGANFVGEIEQVPPKFSALKINGKKAYELARSGKEFSMKKRKVRVSGFEVVDFAWPRAKLRMKVSSGTYVRSLVHDLGQVLGCGAYVVELRRTVLGCFGLEDVGEMTVEDICRRCFEVVELTEEQFLGLQDGKKLLDQQLYDLVTNCDNVVTASFESQIRGVLELKEENVKFKKVLWI